MKGVQFLVILGLALFVVPPAIASDYFDILSIPSHGDNNSELAPPTIAEHVEGGGRVKLGQEFIPLDYLRLAVQWPKSHCNNRKCSVSPLPQTFTIHGLWPDLLTGNFLRKCVTNYPYSIITERPLLRAMNVEWPDIERGNNDNFWKAQWENHGTCSLFLYQQPDFFNLAVNLKKRYDFLGALRTNSIVPGASSYQVARISDAIRKMTSKRPDIGCNKNRAGKEQLHEIHICFSPVGSVTDCPPNRLTKAATCTATNIFFPN